MNDYSKKTRRFNLRITEKEYQVLTEKSKNHGSRGRYIVDLYMNYDDHLKRRHEIDCMEEWAKEYSKWAKEMNSIGINLTQFAKYFNHLNLIGVENDKAIEEAIKEMKIIHSMLFKIRLYERRLIRKYAY